MQSRNITPDKAKARIEAFVTETNKIKEVVDDINKTVTAVDELSEGRSGRKRH